MGVGDTYLLKAVIETLFLKDYDVDICIFIFKHLNFQQSPVKLIFLLHKK